jgi:hypothetical protein
MRILKGVESFLKVNRINEGRIYWSPRFSEVIKRVYDTTDNQKVKEMCGIIYNSYGDVIKDDITFVDFSSKLDYVSHIRGNSLGKIEQLKSLINDINGNTQFPRSMVDRIWNEDQQSSQEGPFNSSSRTETKISRLVNKLITDTSYTTQDREILVNSIKSVLQASQKTFKVVSGEDIKKYYLASSNYSDGGTLGNSCMRYSKCSGYLEIYAQNPNVCQLLLLVDGDDKVHGRAILWNLHSSSESGIEKFMDRIYFINEYEIAGFQRWAKENGYIYKEENNYRNLDGVIMPDSSAKKIKMFVKCSGTFNRFPYVDTFRLYDPKTGILQNDPGRQSSENIGKYILNRTDGDYQQITGMIWSDWEDEEISMDQAVESRVGWIYRSRAIEILQGNDDVVGIWPESHEDVIWDRMNNRYLHRDDCVINPVTGDSIPLLEDEASLIVTQFSGKPSRNTWELKWVPQSSNDYIPFGDLANLRWFEKWSERYHDAIIEPVNIWSMLFSTSKITGFYKNIMGEAMCMSSGQEIKALCPQKYIIEVWYSQEYSGWLRTQEATELGHRLQSGPGKKVCKIDYLLDNAQKLIDTFGSVQKLSRSGREMVEKLENFLRKW